MTTTKKLIPPAGLIAAILLWIFGNQVGGIDAQTVGTVLTGVLATISAAVHGRTVKKVVKKVVPKRHGPPKPKNPITMFDAIELSQFPANPQAVAGYTGGRWPTFDLLGKKFPRAYKLSIAIKAADDAECLDVEQWDATPDQVPEWVKRQLDRKVRRPVVYASLSVIPTILADLRKAGIPRNAIRLWVAHYTYKEHICSPKCGNGLQTVADGTQWTDRAMGRNLDQSQLDGTFFD